MKIGNPKASLKRSKVKESSKRPSHDSKVMFVTFSGMRQEEEAFQFKFEAKASEGRCPKGRRMPPKVKFMTFSGMCQVEGVFQVEFKFKPSKHEHSKAQRIR